MALVKKYNIKCSYCKRLTKNGGGYTRDHVIPKSLGGTNKDNIVHCCKECNSFKSNLTLLNWYDTINLLIESKNDYKCFTIPLLGQIRKSIKTIINKKSKTKKHETRI